MKTAGLVLDLAEALPEALAGVWQAILGREVVLVVMAGGSGWLETKKPRILRGLRISNADSVRHRTRAERERRRRTGNPGFLIMARFMMAATAQVNRVRLPADHLKEATRRALSAMMRALLSSVVPAGSTPIRTSGLDQTGRRGQPSHASL